MLEISYSQIIIIVILIIILFKYSEINKNFLTIKHKFCEITSLFIEFFNQIKDYFIQYEDSSPKQKKQINKKSYHFKDSKKKSNYYNSNNRTKKSN